VLAVNLRSSGKSLIAEAQWWWWWWWWWCWCWWWYHNYDFCLTVHHQLGKVMQKNQLDATMIY